MGMVCIVRHGETEWNRLTKLQGREDIELNDMGRDQARKTGEYLNQYAWDKIYSSPLMRAKETANIIAHSIGIDDVNIEVDFVERDYGLASGMTLEERMLKYPDRQYPKLEDWTFMRDRVFNKLTNIAKVNEEENIIVVTHGATTNSIIHTLTDGEHGSGITKLHMCAINMLDYNKGEWKTHYFNKKVY